MNEMFLYLVLALQPGLDTAVDIPRSVQAVSVARPLSVDERVEHRRAVERVLWGHRLWPKENPSPKPSFARVMSEAALRAQVEDSLEKSEALERLWQHPLSAEELQAELNRMTAGSRDPSMLREIFAAVGNDAFVAAETLARPALADRLIRNWYAFDGRFHDETRRRAEQALARGSAPSKMRDLGGDYSEATWSHRGEPSEGFEEVGVSGELHVDAERWSSLLDTLAARFQTTPDALPVGRVSGLREEERRFVVTAILSKGGNEVRVATVSWWKTPFDAWWAQQKTSMGAVAAVPEGTFSLAMPIEGPCQDDTWRPIPGSGMPDADFGHTAVWTGTEMIVWGGAAEDGSRVNTGGRYNPATDTWVRTSSGPNLPPARSDHTAVWTGTEMIVWGGVGDGGFLPLVGGRYDPDADTWLPVSAGDNVPSGRSSHTAVWTGTEMIVWGGSASSGSVNTGGRYDPSSDSWLPTSTQTNVPSARTQHSAVWTGTEMIVWGGSASGRTNTGGRYDPSTDSWLPTSTGTNVPSARNAHVAVWTGSKMVVWGGIANAFTPCPSVGGRYDPADDTWLSTTVGPECRWGMTAVWTGSRMIVWGGLSDSGGSALNTGSRYDPAGNTWLATPTGANVPQARWGHKAVWTGTEMIVWGGTDYSGFTGGRFNPATNSWLPTASQRLHGGRNGPATVWTGAEMIVWGGDVSSLPPIGDRYSPATDSWSYTSGAPGAGLYSSVGVWTGTEMIVWGGKVPPNQDDNSGARYNPASDTWIATSKGAGVPSARAGAAAVWTGTRMVVWGGSHNSSDLNTGGRYDPTSNSWTPTSTGANVPAPRNEFTVVWTGSEMIVWGGFAGAYVNTGARYEPIADTWTPTSTGANVPLSRYRHSGVWTGDEMIVWGGYRGSTYLDSGGKYDPATDTWLPTSASAGVPSARADAAAVWTGDEMIVWGGTGASGLVNTGGRYDPSTDTWRSTSILGPVPGPLSSQAWLWTGDQMIVWASYSTPSGGLYCAASCTSSPPAPVPDLVAGQVGETTQLTWATLPEATTYDVVMGSISSLTASNGDFAVSTSACLADDIATTSIDDATSPSSGDGWWYLVRGTNCGGNGSYDSGSARQQGSRDAEILVSGNDCP